VEDNPDMNDFLRDCLSPAYRTIAAFDGKEGLATALKVRPHLVLTDVMMPEMSGEELLAALRSREEFRDVPVLVVSAKADDPLRVRLLRQGAQDYLTKPFFAEELMVRAKNLLERARFEKELRRANEALTDSNQELERFAFAASHDLQEPLRTVISYLQLLSTRYGGKLDGDADQFITFTVQAAKRMQSLIRDLLTYARVTKSGGDFQTTDCGFVLKQVLDSLENSLVEKKATVTHDPMPAIRADPGQIGQLFQNFISNALKFQEPDAAPRIHIGVRRTDTEWEFTVRDNGIGIAREFFPKLFSMFERFHPQSRYAGTGMGLAICKRIVDRHQGRIWLESTPGEGSTFHFTIPLALDASPLAPRATLKHKTR
jgi:two-component system, sensor histidine kinase and response regulator